MPLLLDINKEAKVFSLFLFITIHITSLIATNYLESIMLPIWIYPNDPEPIFLPSLNFQAIII